MKVITAPFRLMGWINNLVAKIISVVLPNGLGMLLHFFALQYLMGGVFYGLFLAYMKIWESQLTLEEQAQIMRDIEVEGFPKGALIAIIVGVIMANILPIIGAVKAAPIYRERKAEKAIGKKGTFGDARYSTDKELKQSGLNGEGIVYGMKNRQLIEKPPSVEGHSLVVGGSGTGKSRGVVIPTLLRWQGAAIVIDIKGELSHLTANARNGQTFIFNPESHTGNCYNPIEQIRTVDEAQEVARYLLPEPKNGDPFWTKAAQGLVAAAAYEGAQRGQTLPEVAERLCMTKGEVLTEELMSSPYRQVRLLAAVAADAPEKTLGSIVATLRSSLITLAADENIERATKRSDFTPASLEQGATIYISVSEHMLNQFRELFALMIGQFMRHLSKREENSEPAVLMCLDELPRLGKLETLLDALATLRSRNVHILGVVQSMAQLDTIYGMNERKVIADNCPFKLVLAATDPETQKYFSDLAGQATKMSKSVSTGSGWLPNSSYSEQGVPLVRPETWANLEQPILFAPRLSPTQLQ